MYATPGPPTVYAPEMPTILTPRQFWSYNFDIFCLLLTFIRCHVLKYIFQLLSTILILSLSCHYCMNAYNADPGQPAVQFSCWEQTQPYNARHIVVMHALLCMRMQGNCCERSRLNPAHGWSSTQTLTMAMAGLPF